MWWSYFAGGVTLLVELLCWWSYSDCGGGDGDGLITGLMFIRQTKACPWNCQRVPDSTLLGGNRGEKGEQQKRKEGKTGEERGDARRDEGKGE